ncbi:MAG: molybdenum cofactor biosynthesis protein MoaE [Actinomycetota bacterium]
MTAISPEPLDVDAVVARVGDPAAGAVASFIGTVRESPAAPGGADRSVVRLEYDAHPTLAPEKLRDIAEAAASKWDLLKIVAIHRSGNCSLGEPSVVIACSAPHRGDALDACRWIIDAVKSGVPIWKREVYTDGSSWVGAEGTR